VQGIDLLESLAKEGISPRRADPYIGESAKQNTWLLDGGDRFDRLPGRTQSRQILLSRQLPGGCRCGNGRRSRLVGFRFRNISGRCCALQLSVCGLNRSQVRRVLCLFGRDCSLKRSVIRHQRFADVGLKRGQVGLQARHVCGGLLHLG
jgi:hypothetical protein